MRPVTLVYCVRGISVLLGLKKRGFGAGKLNGYGGKVHAGETIEQAAVRELKEEADIDAAPGNLEKVAEIDFSFADVPVENGWNQTVHVYLLKQWTGLVRETEEMKPVWCEKTKLPLVEMWADDPLWLPNIFEGKKLRASFTFVDQGAVVRDYQITEIKYF